MGIWMILLLAAAGWLLVLVGTLWLLKRANKRSITCPVCGLRSYHRTDMLLGYCRNCHEYTTHE